MLQYLGPLYDISSAGFISVKSVVSVQSTLETKDSFRKQTLQSKDCVGSFQISRPISEPLTDIILGMSSTELIKNGQNILMPNICSLDKNSFKSRHLFALRCKDTRVVLFAENLRVQPLNTFSPIFMTKKLSAKNVTGT